MVHTGYDTARSPITIFIGETRSRRLWNPGEGSFAMKNSISGPTVIVTDAISSPLNTPAIT